MPHEGMAVLGDLLRNTGLMTGSIASQREAMEKFAADAEPPPGCVVEPVLLGGRASERITPPSSDDDAVLLYLHGGAYCMGSPATHRNLAARLAVATGCPVCVLDYRLAPQHPHPAAVEDAVAAYDDLVGSGIAPARVGLAGDSAGGGLVVATLLALRRSDRALPAAAVCFSPWVDLTQSGDSYRRLAELDPLLSKETLDQMAAAYVGTGDARADLVSPLFANDFHQLPPVMIDVGAAEVLLDDATQLADRLRGDGVEVTCTIWPDMIHVFQAFASPLIPEADESVGRAGRFLAGLLRVHAASDEAARRER